MFGKKQTKIELDSSGRDSSFTFVEDEVYADTACQSLRPLQVQQALSEYYRQYPACGGRVKYAWGKKVDEGIETTRQKVLDYLKLSSKSYAVSFTLNTTYGLNLVLQQLGSRYMSITTTDIEHNSVFMSTMSAAKRLDIPRRMLKRRSDGTLDVSLIPTEPTVFVANVASNIDGRELSNIKEVASLVRKNGGVVIVDAAQAMAHRVDILHGVDYDAVCFSAHKMYSASLGVIVARKEFIDSLDFSFVGGGMVQDVTSDDYELTSGDYSSRFEPGLQAFGEILALGSAIDWLSQRTGQINSLHELSTRLYEGLSKVEGLTVLYSGASVMSVYTEKIDAHRLATFLSAQGVMARSGYFCCHYYLLHQESLPPLLRFSLGLHTTEADVEKIIKLVTQFAS